MGGKEKIYDGKNRGRIDEIVTKCEKKTERGNVHGNVG